MTCPKQYEAHHVLKYIPHTDTEATLYGKDLHLAAELYIGNGTPLPDKYSYIKSVLDVLKCIKGEKLCEYQLAIALVNGEYVSCDYEDTKRYWRGIADLIIIDDDKAYIVDYKTGKSAKYADTKQLALLAAGVFLKYPNVNTIKGMLLFVVSNESVKAEYTRENALDIFTSLTGILARRAVAYETGIFNASPNGLCKKWCQATQCIHNGSYKGA
jgi:hypothetical protein